MSVYKIELSNWYQELRNEGYIQKEFYHNLEFETIEDACKYLGENIDQITEWFPVESITIKPVSS